MMTFQEVEDALYELERPYYSYHASGFPMYVADAAWRARFDRERARLTALWHRLYPTRPWQAPVAINPRLKRVSDGRVPVR